MHVTAHNFTSYVKHVDHSVTEEMWSNKVQVSEAVRNSVPFAHNQEQVILLFTFTEATLNDMINKW